MHDNGGTAGVNTFNAGLRGRKTTYYDGGHRSPCFVRWPAGKLRAAGDVDVTTQNQDMLPTLIDLCDLKKPKKAALDGVSLADLLRGKADKLADRMLVVQYGQILKKWDSAVLWDKWRLVSGTELYDLAADPGQKADVAAKHPDVAKKMRAHYEQWWEKLEPVIKEYVPLTLGSPKEPSVRLTSSDWQDIYSDNAGHVRNAVGGPRGGWWNVLIDRAGEYEISLRRWPHEIDTALTGSPDSKSKTMPIAAAKVSVAGMEFAAKSPGKDAREIVLTGTLPKGKTTLRAWFQDADGKDLCGAFYATVTWIGEK
jgi:hypothetical protein